MRSWARQTFHSTAAYADGGGYVNFLTEDEAGRVAASYGSNYERLQKAKRRFDPDNLFRMNLNIVPAGEGPRAAAPGRAASGGGVPAVAATPERRE